MVVGMCCPLGFAADSGLESLQKADFEVIAAEGQLADLAVSVVDLATVDFPLDSGQLERDLVEARQTVTYCLVETCQVSHTPWVERYSIQNSVVECQGREHKTFVPS